MKVNYNIWKNGQRTVRVTDTGEDPASGYHEDAEDFITTGFWGALDPERNQHLVPYREEFLKRLKDDCDTVPAGYCGECGSWCEQDTMCSDAGCPTNDWDEDEDND